MFSLNGSDVKCKKLILKEPLANIVQIYVKLCDISTTVDWFYTVSTINVHITQIKRFKLHMQ